MTREEALNTLMKMRAWREWGKEQKEEERPEMPEQKEVDEAFDVCIKLLQSSLPFNLDEAAEEYGRKEYSHAIHFWDEGLSKNKPELRKEDFVDSFKAGAEWMTGQGVKLHGRILPGTYGHLYIESDWFDRGFRGLNYKFSDSNDVDIFVQIRKKQ